jgi:hypothetical protein
MMNQYKITTLSDLADLLRNIDNSDESDMGFDMNMPFCCHHETEHACGSACCIGGWVQFVRPELRNQHVSNAVAALGADLDAATDLCLPNVGRAGIWDHAQIGPVYNATPAQAARAVEILTETGAVDWPRALKEGAA